MGGRVVPLTGWITLIPDSPGLFRRGLRISTKIALMHLRPYRWFSGGALIHVHHPYYKKGAIPEDRETLFWAVSNSLPGGGRGEQKSEGDKISAQLSMAYRFKVPMIYRPAALSSTPQQPESLQWRIASGGKVTVHNPTRYVVRLNYVSVGGKRHQGKGISRFISPDKSVAVDISAGTGSLIKYGVVNDYGAVREYEGVVR